MSPPLKATLTPAIAVAHAHICPTMHWGDGQMSDGSQWNRQIRGKHKTVGTSILLWLEAGVEIDTHTHRDGDKGCVQLVHLTFS